jgi:hypothetical protein
MIASAVRGPVPVGWARRLNTHVAPGARLLPALHWLAVTAKSLLATRTLLILIAADPSFVTRIRGRAEGTCRHRVEIDLRGQRTHEPGLCAGRRTVEAAAALHVVGGE